MAAERKLEAFDELIGDFRKLDVLRSARLVAPRPEAGGGAPNRFGPHAGAGMIMKRDAAFELGGAAEGSCSLVMATADERLVREGCISLTGDDLADLPWGRTFPFGQVLMVAGADLGPEDVAAVEEAVRVRDWIRGYQVRSVPGEVFVRVAAQAMREGLGFADVGRALSALVRAQCPRVAKVEVAFVTASPDAVKELYGLRRRVRDASHDVRRESMAALGIDIDCPSGGHCGACKDKGTCTEVRRIQALRERCR